MYERIIYFHTVCRLWCWAVPDLDLFYNPLPSGVMCHLKALEKKGLINREEHSARAIQLVDHRPAGFGLPLLGNVAAGTPITIDEQNEVLQFDEVFGGDNRFVLRVRG